MKTPNFFIVGAPKSGTTAIYSYLKQHPEIWMSKIKEPQFFGTDINADYFIRNRDRYLSLFQDAQQEKMIGEASVWYLYSEKAAKEIKEFCPDAKIVIMLRNPIDMVYSLHSQLLYNNTEDISDFERALAVENKRKQGENLPQKSPGPLKALLYKETAKYANQVKRYLDTFGSDRVHFIIYEEFKHNPQQIYRDLLNFLQVDSNSEVEFKVVNSQKKIKSRFIQNFLANPPSYLLQIGRILFSKTLRQKVLKSLMIFNTNYTSRKALDNKLRTKLLQTFKEDIIELSKLLKQDLTRIWT